ncbi:uncharacterized protein FOMMEDRAFT_17401, partial [Fomitiporia mediterranea MF3/22]|uniref:uncharacterized protein n=1 Tax=Fomitiporia mediterranea (strain MF3/22) TaxID=694068 RepID=UPI0004407371
MYLEISNGYRPAKFHPTHATISALVHLFESTRPRLVLVLFKCVRVQLLFIAPCAHFHLSPCFSLFYPKSIPVPCHWLPLQVAVGS